ncbi:MAG: nuclear transport factor 2 family protein [Cytophagales bacterium]|nr:nuclear transport factor 2 family protein [Cytophagales bacterium]
MKKGILLILLGAGIGHQAWSQGVPGSQLAEAHASGNKTAVKPKTIAPETGGDMIVKAVRAYNAKDLDSYIACFSPDVEVYNASGVLMFKGADKLKEHFEAFFHANPNVKRKIIDRVVTGNKIVEREQLVGLKGAAEQSVTSIYELDNGLIKSFFFIGEF